jgi:hypothetical protein
MKRKIKPKVGRGGPRTYRGKPVVDAKKPEYFEVTESDCSRGVANDPSACAAAHALHRSLPGNPNVYVHRSVVMVEYKDKVVRYKPSLALRDQEIRYDAAKKFATGEYNLNPPPPSTIAARGKQHSPPDRKRGNPNSPKRRRPGVALRHELGRDAFHFDSTNSDYRR